MKISKLDQTPKQVESETTSLPRPGQDKSLLFILCIPKYVKTCDQFYQIWFFELALSFFQIIFGSSKILTNTWPQKAWLYVTVISLIIGIVLFCQSIFAIRFSSFSPKSKSCIKFWLCLRTGFYGLLLANLVLSCSVLASSIFEIYDYAERDLTSPPVGHFRENAHWHQRVLDGEELDIKAKQAFGVQGSMQQEILTKVFSLVINWGLAAALFYILYLGFAGYRVSLKFLNLQ